jgi:hypothetical protein
MSQFRIEDHGTIMQFVALTRAARRWSAQHIAADAHWPSPGSFVCERRFAADIIAGLREDGLLRVQVRERGR